MNKTTTNKWWRNQLRHHIFSSSYKNFQKKTAFFLFTLAVFFFFSESKTTTLFTLSFSLHPTVIASSTNQLNTYTKSVSEHATNTLTLAQRPIEWHPYSLFIAEQFHGNLTLERRHLQMQSTSQEALCPAETHAHTHKWYKAAYRQGCCFFL